MRFLVVTNAANHARDRDWFAAQAEGSGARCATARRDYAMLAVQGPTARAIVGRARGDGARPRACASPRTVSRA